VSITFIMYTFVVTY